MSRYQVIREYQLTGDPFVGALLKSGFGLVKGAAKGIGALIKRKAGPAILPPGASKTSQVGALIEAAKRGGKVLAAGAGFGVGAEAASAAARAVGMQGAVAMPRRRGRGVTATELRGFKKVTRLLSRVGMVPKGLRRTKRVC